MKNKKLTTNNSDIKHPTQKTKWPTVVKGSHLTVTTYENGKIVLEWDDDALRKEVKDAILTYEKTKTSRKAKSTKKENTK